MLLVLYNFTSKKTPQQLKDSFIVTMIAGPLP